MNLAKLGAVVAVAVADEKVAARIADSRIVKSIYVPGHGVTASLDDFRLFQEFLDVMEDAARSAHGRGVSVESAAKDYQLGGKFKDWFIFADSVMPAIFRTWYAALESDAQPGE